MTEGTKDNSITLEMRILAALRNGPLSSYHLSVAVEIGGLWGWGVFYSTLFKMEKDGTLATKVRPGDGPRIRLYYDPAAESAREERERKQ
jgi:DNA-binding PadR family transcriptional regulator